MELESDADTIPSHFSNSPFPHQHLDWVFVTVQETKDRVTAVISSSKKSLLPPILYTAPHNMGQLIAGRPTACSHRVQMG
ncbi:hypothetical protein PAXRUDRAFT_21012 [Paxillus rubicundulus Ve08.2h10]|uniref:Uncharacterized protein n=1 Tax=Paxillus rubicundulus Ve08.2h10 TaxID=930991 RepID=A0A0D0D0D6_9AGAM|nr:hypothetical protein PAXRUDRAFT_21012 [Paxillus rubicundulus Ve08.2h10]